MFFWLFLLFVISQRLIELRIARRNEKTMLARGAKEFDKAGYKYIVIMHISFFTSLILEFILMQRELNTFWTYFFIIFVLAQVLRYWSISSLGQYWNTKILVEIGSKRVIKGPYKYIRHPNYIAVVVELASIPLMFSCYITCIVFSILNLVVLSRRIKVEEAAIRNLTE